MTTLSLWPLRAVIAAAVLPIALLPARLDAADGSTLRAGAARVELTSSVKADLPATARYEHERIFVRAIVIDNGIDPRGAAGRGFLRHV